MRLSSTIVHTIRVELRPLGVSILTLGLLPRPAAGRNLRGCRLDVHRRLEGHPIRQASLAVYAVVSAVRGTVGPTSIARPRAERELAAALHTERRAVSSAAVAVGAQHAGVQPRGGYVPAEALGYRYRYGSVSSRRV